MYVFYLQVRSTVVEEETLVDNQNAGNFKNDTDYQVRFVLTHCYVRTLYCIRVVGGSPPKMADGRQNLKLL